MALPFPPLHASPVPIDRLPPGIGVRTRNHPNTRGVVTATTIGLDGTHRHHVSFEDGDTEIYGFMEAFECLRIAPLFGGCPAWDAEESGVSADADWLAGAFECPHEYSRGGWACYPHEGRAAGLHILMIDGVGRAWGVNRARGTCHTVDLHECRPFTMETLGEAWEPPTTAAAPSRLPKSFGKRSGGIPFNDRPCHVCGMKVRDSDFGVQCAGAECPVHIHKGHAHQATRVFHRACIRRNAASAVGPLGPVTLVPPRHYGFHAYRCTACCVHHMRLAMGGAASPLDAEIARFLGDAMVDEANGALVPATLAGYAGTWYRILDFERMSGLQVLQRSRTQVAPPPRTAQVLLAWWEEVFLEHNGHAAKATTLARVGTVIAWVAKRWAVPNPMFHPIVADTLKGIRKRLGCEVTRAFPMRVRLLIRLLVYLQAQPPTFASLVLQVGATLAIFGFLRIGELLRLRRKHVLFQPDEHFPHLIIHLDWCKQDTFQAGCDVIIAAITAAGLNIKRLFDNLTAAMDAHGAVAPGALLFTRSVGGDAHTADTFLHLLRTTLSQMQAKGEPLLANVMVQTDITNKSLKRGGCCSATDVLADSTSIAVHGWVTRRQVENIKSRDVVATYSDVEDAIRSLQRRHRVTFLMGSDATQGGHQAPHKAGTGHMTGC